MNCNINSFFQKYDKRIFIDIASNGCGNGCVYCFTKNPQSPQSLLDINTLDEICDYVLSLPNSNEYIVSLCPNTEPMKSEKSRALVLAVIKRLIGTVKFVQIATKELIPLSYLKELDSLSQRSGQIRISISLPYLRFSEIIEPGAATIDNRLKNFENIKCFHNLISVLYLRPFNRQMLDDKQMFANIIKTYQPDDICLGAEFVPKVDTDQQCTYMYDQDLRSRIFEKAEIEDIFEFAEYLRNQTKCKIFYSSVCNIANCSDYGCILTLNQHDARYCQDCNLSISERM